MLNKVVQAAREILKFDSKESYSAVLSRSAVYHALRGGYITSVCR